MTSSTQPPSAVIQSNPSYTMKSPEQRVTVPEYVEFHMILDQELTIISRPETGVIGSVGFTSLGAAIALIGPVVSVYTKLEPYNL